MDLLERYLQAIGQYLPEETKDDTLAELRENLLARMDAREEELGRPLDESEIAAILKEHGKPELVAVRYLPQRSLIGPTIFPFYLFTLRKVAPLVALVYAIACAASFISAPNGSTFAVETGKALLGLVQALVMSWACVTLIFAVVEFMAQRSLRAGRDWTRWDPMKLPKLARPAGQPRVKSRAGRIVDLVVHCVWIVAVLELFRHPLLILILGTSTRARYLHRTSLPLAPVWHIFFPVLLVLLAVQLVQKIGALSGEHRWDVALHWTVKLIGVGLMALLATASTYLLPEGALWDAQKLVAINHALHTGFRIVLAIAVVQLLVEGWKYGRRWIPAGKFAF